VKPPRVADSPVALECRLHRMIELGGSTVVLGRVLHAAVTSEVFVDGLPDVRRLRPLARLGRDEWCTLGEVRSISRIRHADWPGHFVPDRAG